MTKWNVGDPRVRAQNKCRVDIHDEVGVWSYMCCEAYASQRKM
jgi:hypothetical protein